MQHLLLRLSSFGDLVLCTALAARLRADHPHDRVALLTSADFEIFAQTRFPLGVEVRGLARPRGGMPGWFFAGRKIGRELLADPQLERLRIYDLHGVLKTALLTWGLRSALRGPRKVAVEVRRTPKRSLLRWLSVLAGRDWIGPRHVFREHCALADSHLADPARLDRDHPQLRLHRAPDPQARAHRVLLAPDARYWKKRWPAPSWERFMDLLMKSSPQVSVTLVGGSLCLPQDLRDEWTGRYGARFVDLLGRTRSEDLPEIAANHAVLVCGNSAWLHIAEAAGTPVVTLAGPIVPGFGFSPWRPESVELAVDLDCRPCSRHGGGLCRRVGAEFHACMKRIEPAEVLAAVTRELTRSGGAR